MSNQTSRFSENDDLRVLAVRHLSGELDADQVERFFGRLSENTRFVDDYLTIVFQARLLPKCLLTDNLVADEKAAAHRLANRSSESGSSPVLSFLGASKFARRGWWSVPRLVAAVISSGIVLYFAVLILLLAWERNGREGMVGQISEGSAESPAKIVAAIDSRWASPQPPLNDGDALNRGPVRLAGGQIEIRFDRGAQMIVEGPADFEVRSSNSVFLSSGTIVAKVPPQAIGFTVETPTARVVDLGTEFGVEVDAAGRTDVEVITGKVDVSYESPTKSGRLPQSVRMTAGTAKRFSKQDAGPGVAVTDVAPGMKNRLAKATSRPTNSRRIFVQGAVASSQEGGTSATALIDGSGMKGESHATYHVGDTADQPYHYWLSKTGKIKNEFVLFDFGRPYRLDSMKVWNLNDGRDNLHLSRGVKQADIYVSTSGKWDPLKEPHEWKLVVDDFKFSAATGIDDYDTPNVIPLGGAEGRFVAIVIADHLGPDTRHLAKPDEDVGLSEVQFFGERVTPQPASRNHGGPGKQARE